MNVKVHKNPIATRPISSFRHYFLSPAAEFLVTALRPLVRTCDYVVANSTEVLPHLSGIHIDENVCLIETDVVDMFTSLPALPDGSGVSIFETIQRLLRTQRLYNARLTDFVIAVLHAVLDAQFTCFDGIVFKMVRGIVMGIACSSDIANIFMNDLDVQLDFALLWRRYVDDALCICHVRDVQRVMDTLNGFHPNISFKCKVSRERAVFLDLEIYKHECRLQTKTYRKPVNAYLYVSLQSAHPRHCFRFIRAEALRALRNSSTRHDFETDLRFLRKNLIRRGYYPEFVDRQITSVQFCHRQSHICHVLNRVQARRGLDVCIAGAMRNERTIPVVLPFLPGMRSSQLTELVRSAMHLLSREDAGKLAFKVVFRLDVNIFRAMYAHTWHSIWPQGTAEGWREAFFDRSNNETLDPFCF